MKETPVYQTTRIWKQTIRTLNLISAMSGESIVKTMDRLAAQELARLQVKERKKQMTWNSDTGRYQGTTTDGRTIEVDGDVFAEDLSQMTRTYMEEKGLDEQNASELAFNELIQVAGWTSTPMDGVYQGE